MLEELKKEKQELIYILKNKHFTNITEEEITKINTRIDEISEIQMEIYDKTKKEKLAQQRLEKFRNKYLKYDQKSEEEIR